MTTARAEYCERHDLPLETCADCRPRSAAVIYREPADLGPWIVAAYHGTCSDCGEHIAPGCQIRADGAGGWLDEACGEEAEAAQAARLVSGAGGNS